jgi:hypothetical protein
MIIAGVYLIGAVYPSTGRVVLALPPVIAVDQLEGV